MLLLGQRRDKQELITGFTNINVISIVEKSCFGGAGNGTGQKPE